MKIALIGYGRMGHAIERIALQRGHEVVCRIDVDNTTDLGSDLFRTAQAAIEFTTPATAVDNICRALRAGVPVVSGTTGWNAHLPAVRQELERLGGTLLWSSNFSIGVNLLFELNRRLATLMNRLPQYGAELTEVHHVHKLDAPSGTAVTLADDVVSHIDRLNSWALLPADSAESVPAADVLPVRAVRQGEVPGIHEVSYRSAVDCLSIRHEAFSRDGFALGAVLAAEFVQGRTGFFTMSDLLNFDQP